MSLVSKVNMSEGCSERTFLIHKFVAGKYSKAGVNIAQFILTCLNMEQMGQLEKNILNEEKKVLKPGHFF